MVRVWVDPCALLVGEGRAAIRSVGAEGVGAGAAVAVGPVLLLDVVVQAYVGVEHCEKGGKMKAGLLSLGENDLMARSISSIVSIIHSLILGFVTPAGVEDQSSICVPTFLGDQARRMSSS